MRIRYDKQADAAYIYVVKEIAPGGVKATHVCDLSDIERNYGLAPIRGMINLDFDEDGHLLGIEIIEATNILPKYLLEEDDA